MFGAGISIVVRKGQRRHPGVDERVGGLDDRLRRCRLRIRGLDDEEGGLVDCTVLRGSTVRIPDATTGFCEGLRVTASRRLFYGLIISCETDGHESKPSS